MQRFHCFSLRGGGGGGGVWLILSSSCLPHVFGILLDISTSSALIPAPAPPTPSQDCPNVSKKRSYPPLALVVSFHDSDNFSKTSADLLHKQESHG